MPGVPGIGVKTAAQLIVEYGDLETLLTRAGEIKQDKRRQTLIDNAEIARISKRLVTLDQNVKLEVPVEDLAVHEPDYKNLIAFLKAMEFSTLTRRVAEKSGIDANEIEANGKLSSGEAAASRAAASTPARDGAPIPTARAATCSRRRRSRGAKAEAGAATSRPGRSPPRISPPRKASKIDRSKYETVRTLDRLKAWVLRAKDLGVVAIDTETTSLDPMHARSSAASRSRSATTRPATCRSATATATRKGGSDLFAPEAKLCAGPDPGEGRRSTHIKPMLEDPGVLKVGQNLKFDWQIFARARHRRFGPTTTPC